jgi:hypothetical protein
VKMNSTDYFLKSPSVRNDNSNSINKRGAQLFT